MTQTAQNADFDEIGKFTRLADQWWDKNGAFKPLHDINPLRLNWIDEQTSTFFGTALAGKKVVDVGCGGGILAHSMAVRGADVLVAGSAVFKGGSVADPAPYGANIRAIREAARAVLKAA